MNADENRVFICVHPRFHIVVTRARLRHPRFVFAATIEKAPVFSALNLKRGDKIYCQHDASDAIYRVQEGIVGFSVVSSQGKEALLTLLGPGSYFGDRRLAGIRTRTGTATALTDCALQKFERGAFLHHLSEDRAAMERFVSHLIERNVEYENDLCGHLFDSSEQRLRHLLRKLCRFGVRKGDRVEIPVKLTHDMMAQIIGTTRSRVTFFMNKLRREGMVEYGRMLIIHAGPLADPAYPPQA
jgi:CRP-like cAMP-binding protein